MAEPPQHAVLYHMVPVARWEDPTNDPYYPPTYEQDGFTHLTADPALLLSVANHFYQQSQGPWTVLELSTASLDGKVRYERAAPVGSTAAHEAQQLFPHLYGGINRAAVLALHLMTRDEDGRFLGVPSLGIHTVDENLKIHHHVTNV